MARQLSFPRRPEVDLGTLNPLSLEGTWSALARKARQEPWSIRLHVALPRADVFLFCYTDFWIVNASVRGQGFGRLKSRAREYPEYLRALPLSRVVPWIL